MGVVEYQVAIFAVVMLTTAFLGKLGLMLAVVGAVLWTFVMVRTGSLMALQFVTIVVAAVLGAVLRPFRFPLIGITAVGALVWFINNKDQITRPTPTSTHVAPISASGSPPPALPSRADVSQSIQVPPNLGAPVTDGRPWRLNPKCQFLTRADYMCPAGQSPYLPP